MPSFAATRRASRISAPAQHAPLRPVAAPATLPTSGLGLLGLTERVALAGGRLEQGVTPEGGYRLAVWLPWAP